MCFFFVTHTTAKFVLINWLEDYVYNFIKYCKQTGVPSVSHVRRRASHVTVVQDDCDETDVGTVASQANISNGNKTRCLIFML